jgi:hypothetical protein
VECDWYGEDKEALLQSRVCRRDSGCGSKDEAGAEAASASDVMSVTCPLPLARLGQLQTDTGKYLNTTTLHFASSRNNRAINMLPRIIDRGAGPWRSSLP